MIERWFRSFKYEEAYLTQYANIRKARKAIGKYSYLTILNVVTLLLTIKLQHPIIIRYF